jgi:hypothetical protein
MVTARDPFPSSGWALSVPMAMTTTGAVIGHASRRMTTVNGKGYRKEAASLVAQQDDDTTHRRQPGRPHVSSEIAQLVVCIAEENTS